MFSDEKGLKKQGLKAIFFFYMSLCLFFFCPFISFVSSYEKKIITKCCADTKTLYDNARCIDVDPLNYSDHIEMYRKPGEPSHRKFDEIFDLRFNGSFDPSNIVSNIYKGKKYYFLESGKIAIDMPNTFERYKEIEVSCLEYTIDPERYNDPRILPPNKVVFFLKSENVKISTFKATIKEINTIGFVVSTVFFALMLIVYIILTKYKTIKNMIVMAFFFSSMLMFGALSFYEVNDDDISIEGHRILAQIIFFALLSNFFWLNVMSFNLWWSVCCKTHQPRETLGLSKKYKRKKIWHKYTKLMLYCLYAWGMSIMMTVVTYSLDDLDLTHIPWFVKPGVTRGYDIIRGYPRLFYASMPALILLCVNGFFYGRIIWKIYRTKKGVENRSSAQRFNSLSVYMKLSVLTGLGWIIEVFASIFPDSDTTEALNLFNVYSGAIFFCFFVLKWDIFFQLCLRFSIQAKWIQRKKEAYERRHLSRNENNTVTTNAGSRSISIQDRRRSSAVSGPQSDSEREFLRFPHKEKLTESNHSCHV